MGRQIDVRFVTSDAGRVAMARVMAILALCSVAVSTALTNIFCALFFILFLSTRRFWRHALTIRSMPVAWAPLLLFCALACSVMYTVAPAGEAWNWVGKYVKLLLLPLTMLAFKDSDAAHHAYWAWFATLCVILVLSTSNFLGWTQIGNAHFVELPLSRGGVFKNHIAASLFSAVLFYQAACLAMTFAGRKRAIVLWGIALLAATNVFVMLEGRTGQAVISLLGLIILWRLRGRRVADRAGERWKRLGLGATAALVIAAMFVMTNVDRLVNVGAETGQYLTSNAVTSTGLRMEWIRKGMESIPSHPFFGYGAGGLGTRFTEMAKGESGARGILTQNPHDEYLLMTVQLGGVGLLLFCNLLYQLARAARTLPSRSRDLLTGSLVAFGIGCFANSFLLDFSEGHFIVLLSGILIGGAWRTPTVTPHGSTAANRISDDSPINSA